MASQPQAIDAFSIDHLHADLKGRSVRGGMLTLTSQGTTFVVQSVATVVLARLLMPADFGLVAMVTAITGLGQAFSDLGLSEATIQRPEISHKQVSNLFWVNVAVGLTLMLITVALAPVLAWFYREPRLKGITLVTSLIFLISGLRVQHNALLKRQMRFASLAIRDVAACVVAVPIAIAMALHGAGYWAIIALPLVLNFTAVAITWFMVRWMPGLPSRGAHVGSMIAFGGKVAASYVIINVNRSADAVLTGWYWGAGPLGLYSRAYNLLMLPVRQLSGPAGSVAIPAFSRIQNDPERFARYYLRAVNLIVWISAPMFAFLFVAAQPVIVLVLGKKWQEAAPVFQILIIASLGQLLFETILWLFVSRGQSGRLFKLLLIISPIIVASFAVGLPFGIKGVALSGSLVFVGMFPWILSYTFRGTQLTLKHLGQAMVCPIAACFVGVIFSELALHLVAPQRLGSQFLVVTLGFVAAALLLALVPPIRTEVLSLRNLSKELRLSGDAI